MVGRPLPARDPPSPRDHHRQHRPTRFRPPDAAGADSARHRLHGGGDRAVRRHQRGLQMAGGYLSGRRGAVRARLRLPGRLQPGDPAADGPGGVPDAAAARSHHARRIAGDLADTAADRVQHDAAGERDRDQFLRPAVRHADCRSCSSRSTSGWARWTALTVGFLGVLVVTNPGTETFQLGSLFALGNAVLFGTVTVACAA